jgi:hypothetical protein
MRGIPLARTPFGSNRWQKRSHHSRTTGSVPELEKSGRAQDLALTAAASDGVGSATI